MQTQIGKSGRFETAQSSKYLQQLCKHFAHKTEVSYDEKHGEIALRSAVCRLTAEPDALVAQLMPVEYGSLEEAKDVVDRHLARFAFREGFSNMAWSD